MWSSQQQLKRVLVETIQILCKNSLPNESSFCIEATIGITLSTEHVMVISFKERIKSDGSHLSLMIPDEQDNEQSQSNNMNNKSANCSQFSFPHSSCSRSDKSREDLVSENTTVYEQIDTPHTYSNGNAVDTGVIDSETRASHVPQLGDTEISPGNHLLVPSTNKYAIRQSLDDDNDTKDDVVILKVEDASDAAHSVSGLSTELAAPCVQTHFYAQKQKTLHRDLPRTRFAADIHHNQLRHPISMSFESSDMQQQYVDGPHQHNATFNVS